MKRGIAVVVSCVIFALGCSGTQYRDPSKDKGSREWGPKEIKETAAKMVTSLYNYLKNEWNQPALIKVQRIRNDTSEHIDTAMLADEIVTSLIQKRIQFVNDDYSQEQIKEIEMGMTGLVDPDSAIPVGNLKSPNFFLYGTIKENTRYVGGKAIQYLVVTLEMKELKSNLVRWMERQEFLKASRTTPISF